MITKKKLLGKGALLFFVTLCCSFFLYGYFINPPSLPKNPPEIVLHTTAGPIVFSHRHHFSDDGAAIGCSDCHHNSSGAEDESSEMNCRKCHYDDKDLAEAACSDDATHPRCVGKQCATCHDGEECSFCHRKKR